MQSFSVRRAWARGGACGQGPGRLAAQTEIETYTLRETARTCIPNRKRQRRDAMLCNFMTGLIDIVH